MTSPLSPRALELACVQDWPAAHAQNINGWRAFATKGRSWRVNTVWPLEWTDAASIDASLRQCEAFASQRGIRLAFKLADGAIEPASLPEELTKRGFKPRMDTLVMTRHLKQVGPTTREIDQASTITDEFIEVLRLPSPSPEDFEERIDVVRRMHKGTNFAMAHIDGKPAAVGVGRLSETGVGLYLMRTAPDMRRLGLARDLVRTICSWGQGQGAATAHLQVEEANTAAVALYEREGFELAYRYRYWLRD